jgi:D-glycero-alpha-D-manno-heptose-7-phosphate kinase
VREYGGFTITAAINKYVYVAVNEMFSEGYLLRYSEQQHAASINEIEHGIIRETLRELLIPSGIEIATFADIPAGTGLGSSGAFTVGLLKALAAYRDEHLSRERAAERAAHLELGVLGRQGGAQDHFATAMGGIRRLWFRPDGKVRAEPVADYPPDLTDSLALYYTGYQRDAEDVLGGQSVEGLREIREIGYKSDEALRVGDISAFGALMHEHWVQKRRRAVMSNSYTDGIYDRARKHGAIGGKLVGAGGGGFLLFVTEDRERLRTAIGDQVREVRFKIDREGTRVL